MVWGVLHIGFEVHVHFAAIHVFHHADYKLLVVDWGTRRRGPGTNKVGFYDNVVDCVLQIDGDRGHEGGRGGRNTHVSVVSEDLCGPVRDDQL